VTAFRGHDLEARRRDLRLVLRANVDQLVKLDERVGARREAVGLARPVDHERLGDEGEQAIGVRVIERAVDLVDQPARVFLGLRRLDLRTLRRCGADRRRRSGTTSTTRGDHQREG